MYIMWYTAASKKNAKFNLIKSGGNLSPGNVTNT
jgi:hypothetical protein